MDDIMHLEHIDLPPTTFDPRLPARTHAMEALGVANELIGELEGNGDYNWELRSVREIAYRLVCLVEVLEK